VINLLVGFCVVAIFIAIFVDFIEYHDRPNIRYQKKSIVETFSMIMFFLFFYALLKLRWGYWSFQQLSIRYVLSTLGLIMVVGGCIVNIKGRFNLGKNWSNQIKIYHDHTLVQAGMYKVVRHPLYASLIWMFYGASLIQMNVAVFLANTVIFLPFMIYRAGQEEVLLGQQFPDYASYQKKTGMLFPKILRRKLK
jgi:protein-S-isoprenylcysteine O-methyltransferase Ste14